MRASYGTTYAIFGSVAGDSILPSGLVPGASFLLNAPLLQDVSGPAGPRYRTASTQTESVTGFLGRVDIAGFSPLGVDTFYFPQARSNRTCQAADTLTWVRGSHVLSAGFDMRFVQLNSTTQRNARPQALFNGLATPDVVGGKPLVPQIFSAITLAAAGLPSGMFQTIAFGAPQVDPQQISSFGRNPNFPLRLRDNELDAFVQDEWRVTAKLSLSAGVRLAFAQLPTDADQAILRAFDRPTLLKLANDTATDPTLGCSFRPGGCADNLTNVFAAEFPQDFPTTFGANALRADPRFGFAFAVRPKTVLRGGWGRYTGQFPAIIITESQSSFPDFLPVNVARSNPAFLDNLGNPSYSTSRHSAIPVTDVGVLLPKTLNIPDLSGNLNAVNELVLKLENAGLDLVQPAARIKVPTSQQYMLMLEHEINRDSIFSTGYVGTQGRRLLRVVTPDLGFARAALLPIGTLDSTGRIRTRPELGSAQTSIDSLFSLARKLYEGSASSTYHALQTELRKRGGGALLYGASFTWSHAIDDASDFFDTRGTYALPQNSLQRSERGSSSFDSRLRATGYFTVTRSAKLRGLAGWEFSGIYTAQTGQPFTVNSSVDINRDGNLTDRLNTADGLQAGTNDRRFLLQAPANPYSVLARPGLDGAVGRNSFRAAAWYNADLAAGLRFRVAEPHSLSLRAEVFNVFNRANWNIPVRILQAPGFGSAVDTLTSPRSLQFTLRYLF